MVDYFSKSKTREYRFLSGPCFGKQNRQCGMNR